MSTKKKKTEKIEKDDSIAANTNSTITFYPEPVTNQLFPTPVLFAKLPLMRKLHSYRNVH